MTDSQHMGNWARWGAEDQRGALNLMNADTIRRAMSIVSQGQVFSLGIPLGSRETPIVPPRSGVVHLMSVDGGDYTAGARTGAEGFQFADDYLAMPVHSGTHLDALSHIASEGYMYNGFPHAMVRSASGAKRLGMETVPHIVARALIADVAGLRSEPLGGGDVITADDLAQALDNYTVRPGDAVLIHTGWLTTFSRDNTRWAREEPGIDEDAALWLAERDVICVGADNWAVEVVPHPLGRVSPVHVILIQQFGVFLLEMINLSPLVELGVKECCLIVSPLPIVGGVGSPVNPVAII